MFSRSANGLYRVFRTGLTPFEVASIRSSGVFRASSGAGKMNGQEQALFYGRVNNCGGNDSWVALEVERKPDVFGAEEVGFKGDVKVTSVERMSPREVDEARLARYGRNYVNSPWNKNGQHSDDIVKEK